MEENSYSATELGIKVERFIKKYKITIILLVLAVVVYFIANTIYEKVQENNKIKANNLYISLLEKKDENKLQELKELNPNLYFATLLNDKYSKELSEFKPDKENLLLIDIYKARTMESKYFLKDLKTLENAFELLKDNKVEEANVLLNSITNNSAFYKIANNLKHYQGNK